MSKKINLGGVPVEVVSHDEANQADFVVCVRADAPTPFDDNETGTCCKCGCAVVFRPYVPKTPPRICLDCAIKVTKQ